jgi:hypothetical protein
MFEGATLALGHQCRRQARFLTIYLLAQRMVRTMRSWLDFDESFLGDGEVSLGAVFNELCELIAEHEPKWERDWKKALDNALHALLAEPLDDETRQAWHVQQKGALFLRLEMEAKRLHVFVRDPATKERLRLHPEDWMRFSPNRYIPAGGSDNFIVDGDYGVIGSDGTRFYARLSSAFVDRHAIKAFFNKRLLRSHNTAWQDAVVRQAVSALWNGDPSAPGVPPKQRNFEIQTWAKSQNYRAPSLATIKRTLSAMRVERKEPKVNR